MPPVTRAPAAAVAAPVVAPAVQRVLSPPDNSGHPGILPKDLQSIQLLRRREGFARLDVGPFAVLYAALVLAAAAYAVSGEWHTATLVGYGLIAAGVSHVLVWLFTQWNVGVRAVVTCSVVKKLAQAQCIKVVPAKFSGQPEIVPLELRALSDLPQVGSAAGGAASGAEVSFDFRRRRFVYDAATNAFDEMRYPDKEAFSYYRASSGYGSPEKVAAAAQHWGLNAFDVPLPPFMDLLKEQMLAPFFVFQVFCVLLWTIDEYWYYSIFTLFMLITFESTVVFQRQRNLKELRSLQTPKMRMQVYRGGKWEEVAGDALLPGDVVSVARPHGAAAEQDPVVPADCLLLAGSCIVEEAVLTGESTPQWKVPITDMPPTELLNTAAHRNHCLFGGTRVLQHTGDKGARIRTPDGGCLAVVLRTGFETSQGRLMRTILFSSERITANSAETGAFIAFLLVFAISAAAYVLRSGLADAGRDRFKLALNCVMIITSVVPPELPMELTIAVNASLVALARRRVFCTEPFRIPFAGKVEVCCFDKTGTLTSDHLLLEGVAGAPGTGEEELLVGRDAMPPPVAQVLASCHALVQVEDELVGDPLEKAALGASGWTYAADVATSPDRSTRATILARYHFNSTIKRMAALVRLDEEGVRVARVVAVVKGAPEVLRPLLSQVPSNYDACHKGFAAQGARVIALAAKQLPDSLDAAALRALPREEVEAGLDFVGFAVFQCPLKPESEPTLAALAESMHALVMITGDAPLTAAHAAARVGIVTRDALILQRRTEGGDGDGTFEWVSPDDTRRLALDPRWEALLELAADNDLCLTGDALAHIVALGLGERVIPLVQVFARVSPEQKEAVLKALRGAGRVTLMCGDGTNDVGALAAAHVGVALLSPVEGAEKAKRDKDKGKGEGKKKGGGGGRSGGSGGGGAQRASARSPAHAGGAAGPPTQPAGAGGGAGGAAAGAPLKKGEAMLEEMRRRGQPITPAMKSMADWMDKMDADMGGEPPLLKPGDASMASPFTAKASSVAPIVDIIRQGRCTLVTTVQMFKVLGLLCLASAYSLSVMYLQGVKLSDAQATLGGVLTAGLFFFVSNATPLERLAPVRPHPSIFCAYFFLSLLGQFAAHITFIVLMYHAALGAMPAEQVQAPDTEFAPNLVNSVTYLTTQTVQLITFAVNYVGPPFNTPIGSNTGMRVCLTYSSGFLSVLVGEMHAPLNESFGLVPIPADLRLKFVGLAAATLVGTWLWEHALRTAFPAPTPPSKGWQAHEAELRQLRQKRGGGGGAGATAVAAARRQ